VRKSWTFAALLGLAGCGSDEWIDLPLTECYELELNANDLELMGPGLCEQAGGLRFGEEFRCKDDKVQVRCRKP
jgi:hypothetical protein